ncbi:glycosyltransferase family 61 protein [Oceanobacillus rekensis]|uniref:glycosyltransferase family 61 protein n=1 Tax=Oceanobacillus rekensis TaxID=937927 RepID=UPI000B43A550|nr:glycosyltransferase family 61 protein [Oceanobacillus rekensis]
MNRLVEGMVFVLTPDRKLLRDMAFHLYWDYFRNTRIPSPSYYHGTVAVLAWAGHSNYWHWLHDTVGRFHLLQLSGIQIDKYVLPPLKFRYHRETIETLGIPKNKIIQLTPGMHLRAENLVLPSVPFNIGTSVKWTVDFLRETFLNKESVKNSSEFERIYISREDALWRKVINEEEVMGVLEKRGFKKIVLSSMSVQEQINIFSSAKAVIGSNGAGLTNLLFCNPGTKVIQLFNSTSDEFIKIGNYLNLDYYLLMCSVAYPPSSVHVIMNNLIVNIDKLLEIVDSAEI